MSSPLEQTITPGDWDGLQRFVDVLLRVLIDTGGMSVTLRFGGSSVTWPGATAVSTATTVSHGAGTASLAVLVSGVGTFATWQTGTPTSTSFAVSARTADGSLPAAATQAFFNWIAIG